MHDSSGPHERPGTHEFHEIDAHELRAGQRLLLPDGEDSAEIVEVDTVLDDFEQPALYFAVLDNDMNLRVAHGTRVKVSRGKAARPADLLFSGPPASARGDADDGASAGTAAASPGTGSGPGPGAAPAPGVPTQPNADPAPKDPVAVPRAPRRGPSEITLDTGDVVIVPGTAPAGLSGPSPDLLTRIPAQDGEPEDLIRDIDQAHPGRQAVNELAGRLARGINVKSGACLKNLRDLAFELYVGQDDADRALKVADLLAVLPYDGNPARWASIESALGLASHLARATGDDGRAEAYGGLLRAPDTAETDPFRAKMAERVRERALNEPNLYDSEVDRAVASKDHAEERAWRILRLSSLLHLRAHGGSRAFAQDELDRRIEVELGAIRA
ncbi:hypothetical protein RBS60_06990 [Sinomonas sp. ASV486]|uniref:DUF6707 family protein n=1 Tax=Sinomonas sp. ASV486 TaxID=3051170 RepID=UPI0027DB4962|nr:DUF6707 family protein [Sinomonas sp. ASV486]MDQ4489942.1 hypothetical protein [Sinomonas sp. ASV486]